MYESRSELNDFIHIFCIELACDDLSTNYASLAYTRVHTWKKRRTKEMKEKINSIAISISQLTTNFSMKGYNIKYSTKLRTNVSPQTVPLASCVDGE